ncbi:MAG: prolyl oligopeptidase family serine peptidase [Marinilabiliaceae bacterium]|jgi:dipeptidyl aminopeptidase/acylaminoacyl peptidase|nr:prolyl oligopeptidase family serine peptidase [Marinilabiliaceae bacterium]
MKKFIPLLIVLLLVAIRLPAQTPKKALDHNAIAGWNRITETVISADGKWIVYKLQPWEGDTKAFLYNSKGEMLSEFDYAENLAISADSKTLVFKTVTPFEQLRELKRKKTKKDDMPGETLNIFKLEEKELLKYDNLLDYSLPREWGTYIAFQLKAVDTTATDIKTPDTSADDSKKLKKESSKNGYELKLLNLETNNILEWPFVKTYRFAKDSGKLVFVSTGDGDTFKPGLYLYDIEKGALDQLFETEGEIMNITMDDKGDTGVFIFKEDSKKDRYSIYRWRGNQPASMIVSDRSKGIPEGWLVSGNYTPQLSIKNDIIFFGTAPAKPEADTLRLEEEYPDVQIWHGTEGKLHTAQLYDKARDSRISYLAAWHDNSGEIVQLGSEDIPDISLINRGDSKYVLGLSNVAYELQSMWEGSPLHYDVYLIDLKTGKRELIKKDIRARVQASPAGKYLVWYSYPDASYYSYNISEKKEYRLTSPDKLALADELNDVPNYAGPYRPAGWLENDEAYLVNDRYDIWKLDPEARYSPVNMTVNGRESNTSYSYLAFDREQRYIDISKPLFLTGSNDQTRASYYYSWDASAKGTPKLLYGGEYSLSAPLKAKSANTVVFSKSTFETFPDLLLSDLKFRKEQKISNANPQQADYSWGTAELVSWISLDGMKLEGLLYKPENFDPGRKYPMIVNFYEKSSQGLYDYRMPELHRSTIDYHYYTSNGYVIFNPDVYYKEGYPGESAFNCVMPGITAIINMGFVDKDRIGAQGHSWGGYQVAYLATRTNLFAAIESGAPVVNMFSAYGGIRWGSGLNRSFQYEHTQSRIGATIWESPLRYLENSPLFTMDKVTTPILILHNDADGAVPWYQGIEYFIALRRLQKPVWMLNYTGEPHWPQEFKNKKDFQIRMAQFFDHFLKGKAMPLWMKEGIPVVEKEFKLGYELSEK